MPDFAVVFGGPSPEHDVSVLTGLQAARALAARVGSLRGLYWSKTGEWFEVPPVLEAEAFLQGVPRGAKALQLVAGRDGGFVEPAGRLGRARAVHVDAALICCHGGPGEDGTLQAALDLAGVAYSGPTVAGAALGMDKLSFGAVMAASGLPTLPRMLVSESGAAPTFDGPYIVKPRFGGSSVGIEVVEDFETARARLPVNTHLAGGAVLEPYRPDFFDLQVAIRTWPELQISSIERPLRSAGGAGILGYGDKYVAGEGMAGALRELPARIDPGLAQSIADAARKIAVVASARGVARIDFLSDGTDWVVNELNTVPGSLARYLWIDPAVAFPELLDDLFAEARARPTHVRTADGADGSVLQSAGSIASKLG